MIKVGIVGGTGYGAVELVRFLTHHPKIDEIVIYSQSKAGEPLTASYPHMLSIIEQPMQALDKENVKEEVDVLFFATPTAVSHEWIPDLVQQGITCIDLSGDFRLNDPDVYEKWYRSHTAEQSWLDQAVYGLSEVYREDIKGAKLIANPGCYPTAALLGLMPVIEKHWVDTSSIIVDGKTGVSGAGRSLSLNVHYSEMNENTKAYGLGVHKHTPEMERYLSEKSGNSIKISFSPHIVPMTRGIITTTYVNLSGAPDNEAIHKLYKAYYEEKPFVRVRPLNQYPGTKEVYGSNYCDIGIKVDERTNRLVIVSVIDNLVKGAAGQAIQNMNIQQGWDETIGLMQAPLFP